MNLIRRQKQTGYVFINVINLVSLTSQRLHLMLYTRRPNRTNQT